MKINLKKFIVALIAVGLMAFAGFQAVLAVTDFGTVKDALNRVKANETSGITHTIIFTTATAFESGTNTITIVAPDADDGLWCRTAEALGVTACTDDGATELPGSLTAACTQGNGGTGDTITISAVGALTTPTKYCVKIDDTGAGVLGTDDTAGSHAMTVTTIDDGVDKDQGDAIVHLVGDDQVAITATVPATLSFTLTPNEIYFGTLTTGATKWADATSDGSTTVELGTTITAATNSETGYNITVTGTTLTSTETGADTITAMPSEAVLDDSGSEQFGIRILAADGAGAADGVYDNNPENTYALVTAAFPDIVAASATASDTTTYTVYYIANILATTEAHTDYTATLTYVATGNF